jgi:2-polyprenyl-3-methyl-5-hydroxy-6-metoxy-1,4-benzoquinol methylase
MEFEEIYASAGADLEAVPWASLAPHRELVAWLDEVPRLRGRDALVVGCGLGDDAEAVSRRGCRVTAFDIAPTAIATCRRSFPDTLVCYRVADLFALPDAWRARFDLVVEIRTLQSLPPRQRADAAAAIAATVRPGGVIWVRCLGRDEAEPVTSRPWPVSRSELRAFVAAGLRELEFHEEPLTGRGRSFTVVYRRD